MKTNLEKFYSLVEHIKIAMMTTRRPDGHLESRAMANQKQADGADLWFVTAEGSGKLRDIEHDPHVNLAYYKADSYEWVSASGVARVSKDRAKIRELYEPDWKAWFGDGGDPRGGTADDPRIVLIGVDVHVRTHRRGVVVQRFHCGFVKNREVERRRERRRGNLYRLRCDVVGRATEHVPK